MSCPSPSRAIPRTPRACSGSHYSRSPRALYPRSQPALLQEPNPTLTQEQDQGRQEAARQRHGRPKEARLGNECVLGSLVGTLLSYQPRPHRLTALTGGGGPLTSPTLADEGKHQL